MLPAPSTDDLAAFTGRAVASYSAFADQALAQATLLFSVLTKREEYPTDPAGRQLAFNAIMELADRIYLEQRYSEVKASPFQSETIGSYTYSKAIQSAKNGQHTGLSWWDIAIDELSEVERSLVSSGSLSALERDHVYTENDTGRRYVLGPADFSMPDLPFDVNSEKQPHDPPR